MHRWLFAVDWEPFKGESHLSSDDNLWIYPTSFTKTVIILKNEKDISDEGYGLGARLSTMLQAKLVWKLLEEFD